MCCRVGVSPGMLLFRSILQSSFESFILRFLLRQHHKHPLTRKKTVSQALASCHVLSRAASATATISHLIMPIHHNQYLAVLQMQPRLGQPQLQLPHLEPHPQLLTWMGCSQQPCPPQKLPLRGLPHSCGHPRAQLKAGGGWVVPKQAWVCKEISRSPGWECSRAWESSLVWGFSLVLQWGTCLVSCLFITDCNMGVVPARRLENEENGGSNVSSQTQESLYTLSKPSTIFTRLGLSQRGGSSDVGCSKPVCGMLNEGCNPFG